LSGEPGEWAAGLRQPPAMGIRGPLLLFMTIDTIGIPL
jgi:hypothetical protein